MSIKPKPYIAYIRNVNGFEYNKDIQSLVECGNYYNVIFNGTNKEYHYGKDKIKLHTLISSKENVLICQKGVISDFDCADDYGRYYMFRNSEGFCKEPVDKDDDIEISEKKKNVEGREAILNYFGEILKNKIEPKSSVSEDSDDIEECSNESFNDIIYRAIKDIKVQDTRSVLSYFLDGTLPKARKGSNTMIYPFGCNASQKIAISNAFQNSISVIEGPPGTGKTQTILNIIANAVCRGKTVAVVSNNNSAVSNVQEKLAKCGYGDLIARLGSKANQDEFFSNITNLKINSEWKITNKELSEIGANYKECLKVVDNIYINQNRLAQLKSQLSDINIEYLHFANGIDIIGLEELDKKFHCNWNISKTMRLKRLVGQLKYSFFKRLKLFFIYKFWSIFKLGIYNDLLPIYANYKYYKLKIVDLEDEIKKTEEWLTLNEEKQITDNICSLSKNWFNASIYNRYKSFKEVLMSKDYKNSNFQEFMKRYPIITSSTHSLHNSVPNGYLIDYLIIDEASQVDIIKASVCFAHCRNVIVVGDSMQLNRIADSNIEELNEIFKERYSVKYAYDYNNENIIISLKKLYGLKLKFVILKEHYRCHPIIIDFCNKKFYNNQLIIMTENKGVPFNIIKTNISRRQRLIDETKNYIKNVCDDDIVEIGVISPYRAHANEIKKQLQRKYKEKITADTIHKFQGREKKIIIFNTTADKLNAFNDDSNLINVAVSRAIDKFVIIMPNSLELPNRSNTGDLVRYIRYTSIEEIEEIGNVRSVFDILYKEYNAEFKLFIARNRAVEGSPAEIIIYNLLRELLEENNYKFLDFVREYKLRDLVRSTEGMIKDDVMFIKNNSRLDFLLYNKIDKCPILAIEVDGKTFHSNSIQQKRDERKNRILNYIKIPLLRLETDSCNEEVKIREKLDSVLDFNKKVLAS